MVSPALFSVVTKRGSDENTKKHEVMRAAFDMGINYIDAAGYTWVEEMATVFLSLKSIK